MKTNFNDSSKKDLDIFQTAQLEKSQLAQIKGGEDVIVVSDILTI